MAQWIKIKDVYVNEDYIVSVNISEAGKVMIKFSGDAPPTGVSVAGYAASEVPELVAHVRRKAGVPAS